MNRPALVLLAALLAGCNVHSKNPASGDDNVVIHADENGSIAFNLPIAQGQVKVPTGFMHNGNFDIDGVKLMPGSSMTGLNVDAGDKRATVNMSFKSPGTPDQVRSYFVDQFKEKGVEAAISGDAVNGKSKDGTPFVIHVSPAPEGSQGTIVIEDND
jgi:hypothetical protein